MITRLGTRLLLPLLAAVAGVMIVYTVWAVRQREQMLTAEAQRETHAYAFALGLAVEAAFRDPAQKDVQEIIDRLSRERTIYGVLIYDLDGRVRYWSEPLNAGEAADSARVAQVMRTNVEIAFERDMAGAAVYSVLRPIRDALGGVLGAYEVAQPLEFLREDIARTRQRFLLNTVTLLLAVTIVILWLVRGVIARPLARLLDGVRAVGHGDLSHRVGTDAGPREFAELANEFDRMASRLEIARSGLVHEAEERLLLERRLRETEKLAAVGNIAAGLAHEVGAPLHVVRGRAELMMRREDLSETDQRNLRIIVDQIARITRIVQNLLDFSRRREPRLAPVDLVPVIRSVAEFLDGEFARAGVEFAWEGPESMLVRGDPHLLHQVFLNLFVNALQALEGAPAPRCIVARAGSDAGAPDVAVVTVEDTGPGIAADLLDGIFEPFFTTRGSGGGTGLGLAVVRSIVEEHGGRIAATNRGGGGAIFRIELPLLEPEPAHA